MTLCSDSVVGERADLSGSPCFACAYISASLGARGQVDTCRCADAIQNAYAIIATESSFTRSCLVSRLDAGDSDRRSCTYLRGHRVAGSLRDKAGERKLAAFLYIAAPFPVRNARSAVPVTISPAPAISGRSTTPRWTVASSSTLHPRRAPGTEPAARAEHVALVRGFRRLIKLGGTPSGCLTRSTSPSRVLRTGCRAILADESGSARRSGEHHLPGAGDSRLARRTLILTPACWWDSAGRAWRKVFSALRHPDDPTTGGQRVTRAIVSHDRARSRRTPKRFCGIIGTS